MGRGFWKDAVLRAIHAAGMAGMRAPLVHAISGGACYEAYGFVASPVDPTNGDDHAGRSRMILNARNRDAFSGGWSWAWNAQHCAVFHVKLEHPIPYVKQFPGSAGEWERMTRNQGPSRSVHHPSRRPHMQQANLEPPDYSGATGRRGAAAREFPGLACVRRRARVET